ncbi:MAG TPA: DUF6338 family protein [Longimicrobium sp.]
MEISSVTLRVLLLFFPGVLCAMLVDALTAHRERTPVQFLTHAFALGMGSYLSLALARDALAAAARGLRLREPLDVTFFDALLNDHTRIAWREIVVAAVVGVVLSCVVVAVINRRLVARFANVLRITKKTGGLDVWNFVFSSRVGDYVVVRDISQDTGYLGTVEVFSETSDQAELLLTDVVVFSNSTSVKLYEAEYVYLARNAHSLVIEPGKPSLGLE